MGHSFPINEGVPDLVVRDNWTDTKTQTVGSFSAKWERIPDYRNQVDAFYEDWYLQRYGFRNLDGLEEFLSTAGMVLEAGTGTGRDARMYALHSRAQVFGIDISVGIHAAYRDLNAIENLHLLQADLTNLPFPDQNFDFIACDQVLHHTPEPKESLRYLLSKLRVNGNIAFYLYRKKGPIREFCDDYIRETTTNMSEEECFRFSESITKLGRSLAQSKVKIEVPEAIPLLELSAGAYDLQRFFHWNIFKCFWNDDFSFHANVMNNFDWYHPKDAFRYAPEEVEAWCKEMHLIVKRLDVIEAGISVIAQKMAG